MRIEIWHTGEAQVLARVVVREGRERLDFEVRQGKEPSQAEVWDAKENTPLATLPDEDSAVDWIRRCFLGTVTE